MSRGVLFVHNNFPGQFADLVQVLLARGVPCLAIGQGHAPGVQGVKIARYNLPRGSTPGIFPLATRAEADLLRARGAYDAAVALKNEGWDPAVIVGHPGWGEMTFMAEVFPKARQVAFAEFYYHGRGFDVGFDTALGGETDIETVLRADAKNGIMAMAYAQADAIVTPTPFQASSLPRRFREGARIFHEGVDLELIRPAPAAPFVLDDGRVIAPGTPVITHVNNHMEPMRGLQVLANALPRLLAEVPHAQVILIGDPNRKSYGAPAPDGMTWRDVCFQGLDYDPARVHFLGRVPHARMLAALRLGVAHVYYTYPFVLSWSLSEAMASGCYVIGSDTAPVRDAIQDGVNGRLLPFFDHAALSTAMIAACRDPRGSAGLRAAARATAEAMFSRAKGREAWLALLREMGVAIPAD
ncbi:MAG: glycosyltransferase [Alphaproteobacteria bacterium]|nr:glycosyltransferase [Alphaproteobacteria bacterium]MBU1513607.1 glycosyltransferase [Alphaproteobacteria bacterium]MBU2094748.1 glycosyltransferase [Alphaproteobacteria bacterium]MBU2150183.1 glycosyltransferase [Alphaproteobacteria bacterium]MBU2309288.1 glycosyltransferase [Alphaproteobacteria bacterium]